MTELFYTILNMSISASILVLVVLLLRLLFRKAPKWVTVLLWGLVAVRLICPFALETPFSLMPKAEWITEKPAYNEENQYFDSVPPDRITVDSEIGNDINVHYYTVPVEPHIEVHRGVNPVFVLNGIWIAGVAAMLVYMLVSYICVYRRIRGAEQFKDNIYTSEAVSSPFVFGLIRPRIYLPENMDAISMSYVIAHEEAHLRRLDHLWKPLGFLLLTVHWFNPLIWIGYILLCRDIEMACDERVVRGMNEDERVDYSEALLDCSVNRKMITACPLAFGEVGAKERIKTVLNYKKPAFWIVVIALVACVVAAVCFLTNPITIRNPWVQEYIVGAEGILGQVDKEKFESVHEDFAIGADKYGRAVFKNPFKAFDTMKELYTDGLTLIAEEQELAPISQSNYNLYKKFGWQVTSGSKQAQEQARFVTNFLDIYENSFDKEKPNTDLPDPTVEGETGSETVIASNVASDTLTYEILKQHQEEIWAYRTTAINDTVDETLRKWGERIAAAGVDEAQNCVVVYVYDFDEGDIGRFKKALGHLSYILVEKNSTIEMIPDELETVKFVDFIDDPSGMYVFVDRSIEHQDFPGVSFHYTAQKIYAKTENGEDTILSEDKIWNCYFSDVTGDGKADLCTTVTKTKPFIARRVVVYDYVENRKYEFSDHDGNHYVLSSENGFLTVNRYANADAYENEPSSKGSLTIINNNLALAVYAVNKSSGRKQLTLDDVIQLSAKGTDLTWEDFAPYACRDVGSGLYICRYEIDDIFHLLVGDGKLTGTPMYIRLKLHDGDAYADVTKDDVAAFIREHTSVKISVDSSVRVPQPVLDYALSLLQNHIDTYNGYGESQKAVTGTTYTITEAKIMSISQFGTLGTAGLSDACYLYKMECLLKPTEVDPANIFLAGGMLLEDGWFKIVQPYFAMYQSWSSGEEIWKPMGIIDELTIASKYGTAEMLDKYGNMYTATLMEMLGTFEGRIRQPITITELPKDANMIMEHHRYIHDESEYTRYILVSVTEHFPNEKFTNVRLTSMILGENGMEPDQVHYTFPELTHEKPLLMGVVFYGDLTTYGLMFTDENGSEYRYMISESGKDGSVVLQQMD